MIKEVKSPKNDDIPLVNPTPAVLDDVFKHDVSIPLLRIEDIVTDATNHTIH